jgi:hypothetical protein
MMIVIFALVLTLAARDATARIAVSTNATSLDPFPPFPLTEAEEQTWEAFIGTSQVETPWVTSAGTPISDKLNGHGASWVSPHPIVGLRCALTSCAAIKPLAVHAGRNESQGLLGVEEERK